jgi:hypothetical protein
MLDGLPGPHQPHSGRDRWNAERKRGLRHRKTLAHDEVQDLALPRRELRDRRAQRVRLSLGVDPPFQSCEIVVIEKIAAGASSIERRSAPAFMTMLCYHVVSDSQEPRDRFAARGIVGVGRFDDAEEDVLSGIRNVARCREAAGKVPDDSVEVAAVEDS